MTITPCVFCQIRDGQIGSDKLHDDEEAFVIRDINPKAPTHLLIIPRQHIPTVSSLADGTLVLMAHLIDVANDHAEGRLVSVLEGGYNVDVLPMCVAEHLAELLKADAA